MFTPRCVVSAGWVSRARVHAGAFPAIRSQRAGPQVCKQWICYVQMQMIVDLSRGCVPPWPYVYVCFKLFSLSLNWGQCSPVVSPRLTQRPIWCLSDPIQVLIRCPFHPSADNRRAQIETNKQKKKKMKKSPFHNPADDIYHTHLTSPGSSKLTLIDYCWTYVKLCRCRCEYKSGDFFWREMHYSITQHYSYAYFNSSMNCVTGENIFGTFLRVVFCILNHLDWIISNSDAAKKKNMVHCFIVICARNTDKSTALFKCFSHVIDILRTLN